MSTEQNKLLARRCFKALADNDQTTLKELLAPDFLAHMPNMPGPLNREAFRQHLGMFAVAFSDGRMTVEDQIAEGDKVVTRATWRAIHSGNFQGLPPTGRQVAIGAIIVQRLKEGKIVEYWPLFDMMGLMQQLGLVPPSQSAR